MFSDYGLGNYGSQSDRFATYGYAVFLGGFSVSEVNLGLLQDVYDLMLEVLTPIGIDLTSFYEIIDIIFEGGGEGMVVYPQQTVQVKFSNRNLTSNALEDATSVSIIAYDPKGSPRVTYTASNLTKLSTGKYRYYFNMPSAVIAGDWYAKLVLTTNAYTAVAIVHFEVRLK